ncbi:SHOCT domain-containing protein, partial [Terrabacter terrae]|uniref:SHOCT domain-containing protein n=1 Tax=Terrabacter terrae TaxID=318434 RepID=UPI0031CE9C14
MPGLLRGVARTAVVAGTASAVAGRVQRRQAEKFAGRDANIAAQQQEAYDQQYQQQAPPPPPEAAPPAAAPASSVDVVEQL